MRFIAFQNQAGKAALGARVNDELVDLTALGLPATLDELLGQGDAGMAAAKKALAGATQRLPLAGLKYLPPLANPSKAFAIGLNYLDHASESKFDAPKHPVIFQRFASSWVAHGQAIVRPHVSEQFDYEAEFVTADELPPGASGLQIQCRLNGTVMQNSNTKDMIFDVATLVAACSDGMELQPGDIIITGTPAGVGVARKPPVFMKAGDVCEIEVEGLGILRNPVVDEA